MTKPSYMRNLTLLFTLLFAIAIKAQTTRFIYQVTMHTDSADKANAAIETAMLDVTGQKSVFYAENRLKRDSVMNGVRQTGNFNFDRNQMQALRTNLDFTIEKDLATQKKTFETRIGRDTYRYVEDRAMVWKILPETAEIGDYKTQKAETEFGGRKWFGWFTIDIPLQDGPYKFSGLPGLIVKVEDSTGDYSFDLKETKKVAAPATFERRGSPLVVKREVFLKQQQQFQQDPLSAMGRRGGRIQLGNAQQMQDRIKERLSKNNNPIEIN